MVRIHVEPGAGESYQVTVTEGAGVTEHTVTAAADYVQRVGGGTAAEDLVEASFRFLLDREPKEAILGHFDLPVISRYFPEYESKIRSYL